jgi:hypothetical protein
LGWNIIGTEVGCDKIKKYKSQEGKELIKMRKFIMLLGIIVTAIVLLSGAAVAPFGYAIYSSSNTTNESEILGTPDGDHATLGKNNPSTLGWIVVDLGSGNGMPASTQFTVYADGDSSTEDYDVGVSEDMITEVDVGSADDSDDQVFTTPSYGTSWRYIRITGSSGSIALGDLIYGPEVDAVGW